MNFPLIPLVLWIIGLYVVYYLSLYLSHSVSIATIATISVWLVTRKLRRKQYRDSSDGAQ